MNVPDLFSFQSPVKIDSGWRALENIPLELAGSGARKPLVLCGPQRDGTMETFTAAFADSGTAVVLYEGPPADPDPAVLRELWNLYRDRGCDAIIALGGRATADAAKVLNIAVSGRPEDVERAAGGKSVAGPLRPFFYCPTTPGDGRETSCFARLGKWDFSSQSLMPNLAVIDPRLLREGPSGALGAALVSALATAVEACLAPARNPLSDVYAGVVIRLAAENACAAKKRTLVLAPAANALCLSGVVLSNTARGPASRLAVALSAKAPIREAAAMAVLLPHAAAFLAGKPPRLRSLILALAGADAPPASLGAAGLSKETLPEAARLAACGDGGLSEADGLAILSLAWKGTP
ncbi:MAG: NAD-dependent methanol dehydrogenase [Syntrophaceae bacterium PtaU1.Bin231]|nr:MAG: NAD-dependent methanol dehydrogenase [Syntrophaceae bacterium PtaU1.Bin231]